MLLKTTVDIFSYVCECMYKFWKILIGSLVYVEFISVTLYAWLKEVKSNILFELRLTKEIVAIIIETSSLKRFSYGGWG